MFGFDNYTIYKLKKQYIFRFFMLIFLAKKSFKSCANRQLVLTFFVILFIIYSNIILGEYLK